MTDLIQHGEHAHRNGFDREDPSTWRAEDPHLVPATDRRRVLDREHTQGRTPYPDGRFRIPRTIAGDNLVDGRRGITEAQRDAPLRARLADMAPKNLIGIPWRTALARQDDSWILRNDIIWSKLNVMPETMRQMNHPRGRNPGNVWEIPTQPFPDAHFAVMPLALAERCIQAGCKPGGAVLDPFSGSGTTGLAAAHHGRRYVGIDLSRKYLDLSLRTRLVAATLDFEEGVS